MDKQLIEGYLAGLGFIIVALIFIITSIHTDLTLAMNQITMALGGIFGILGLGSIIRPESIGQITSEWVKRIGQNSSQQSKKEENITVDPKFRDVYGDVIITTKPKSSDITTNVSKPKVKKIIEKLENGVYTRVTYEFDNYGIIDSDSSN